MDYWSWHTETSLLLADEVLVHSQAGVALYDGDKKTQWTKGKIMLTTHRLLYQDMNSGSNSNSVLQLQLEDIHKSGETPSNTGGFAFSSDKIVVPLPAGKHTRISFRDGGMKGFYEALNKILQSKPWRQAAATTAPATGVSSSSSYNTAHGRNTTSDGNSNSNRNAETTVGASANMVGIAGIMRASEQRSQMQETFKDIDDVMAKASSLVSNIRQLKDRAAASDRTGQSSAEEQVSIESIEATLGLGRMVSSSRNGGGGGGGSQWKFHEELAGELHAWMTHPNNVRLFGEMPFVPLIELFSLYNRARSGDLVSPDDVLQACKVMTKQPYAVYALETLSSGRMALAHKDDTIVLSQLVILLGPMLATSSNHASSKGSHVPKGLKTIPTASALPKSSAMLKSVNEVQLANKLRVATPVAKDVLEKLSAQGYLCECDAGYGCSTYYWNIFVF